jgi:hypothetical protein
VQITFLLVWSLVCFCDREGEERSTFAEKGSI